MVLKIVVDSSLNVPDHFLQEYGIVEVPALVIFGPDEVYRNKVDISDEEFYHRLVERGEQPTTSQPTPMQFVEGYREAGSTEILCCTVSSKLSGTYNSAVQAAEIIKEEGINVTVWDTLFASMGGGWQAVVAARMAREGKPLSHILQTLERVRARSFGFLTVETLSFLARAGRISRTQARVGNALNIKPVLEFRNGFIEVIGRERGRKRAVRALIRQLKNKAAGRPVRLGVGHARARADAEALLALCHEELNIAEEVIVELGPVLGAIGGPGLIGLAGHIIEDEE